MNELLRRIFNLPEQASSVARDIDILHYVVLITTTLGAIGVAAAIAVLSLRYRQSGPREGERKEHRTMPVKVEFFVIAGLLAMFVAFWFVGFRQYVWLRSPPKATLDVYVVGKQWMWAYAYADGTATNADLYVPVGVPVKLTMTSRDVIHSFFVPAFRVKHDVVPGRMTVTWFEAVKAGTYDILCTEYCGHSHSLMRGRVIALAPEHYQEWKRQRFRQEGQPSEDVPLFGRAAPLPSENLAAVGERIASERGCLRCHTLDGTPHLGPSWARLYNAQIPLTDGTQVVADDAYLTQSMMDPMAQIHAGYAPIMPAYLGILTAPEVGAMVALIHALEHAQPALRPVPLSPPQPGVVPLPADVTKGAATTPAMTLQPGAAPGTPETPAPVPNQEPTR